MGKPPLLTGQRQHRQSRTRRRLVRAWLIRCCRSHSSEAYGHSLPLIFGMVEGAANPPTFAPWT